MFGDKTQPLDTKGKRLTKKQQQRVSDLSFSVVEGKLVRKNIGFSDSKELDLSAVTHHFLLFFHFWVCFFFWSTLLILQRAACRDVCTPQRPLPTTPVVTSALRSDCRDAQCSAG